MSFVNYNSKEIISKIVFYGPSLGGKTTNIKYIDKNTNESSKGKLISMQTETERTLFFDFLPLLFGNVNDFNVRIHLYTVPGQIFYESSRKLLLKGVDGLIFVADSARSKYEENIESINSLIKDLHVLNIDIMDLPMVVQYNKRDLDSALPVSELCHVINKVNAPEYEAVATQGIGVFESLKGITKIVMANLKSDISRK